MSDRFCMHCGTPVPPGSNQRYCLNCGRPLDSGAPGMMVQQPSGIPVQPPTPPMRTAIETDHITPMGAWKMMFKKCARMVEGRSRRREYWMAALMNLILYGILFGAIVVVGLVGGVIAAASNSMGAVAGIGVITGIVVVAFYIVMVVAAIPQFALAVRRLHDTGKSGWYMLLILIPIVGAIALLVFMCQDSTPGSNQYGPNPKGM